MRASPYSRVVLIHFIFALVPALASAAWPGRDYSEARGYAFNLNGGFDSILRDGRINESVVDPEGTVLTEAQIQRLIAALAGPHVEHPTARCFNPRHAFVFYDGTRQPVAVVDICFECLGALTHPEGARSPYDFPALAELCAELELPAAPDARFRGWFDDFRRSFAREMTLRPAEPRARRRWIR